MKVHSILFVCIAVAIAAFSSTSSLSAQTETAVYNSTLKAPECATVGSSCDSGPSLLLGRDSMSGGAEPNQPNTINSSCADGKSGTFHSSESNDRIVVASTNGGALTQGNTVTVTATVWVYSISGSTKDYLDIYYTANASSPSWVLAATIAPTATGAQTLSTTYTLPTGSLQAVRANFRSGGSAAVCTTGSYDDHDDLIFAVAAVQAPAFSLSATNASDTASSTTTTTATSTVTETITNGFSSPVTLTASGMPSGVTAAFSPTSITGAGTSTLTFTVPANQSASTSTITVTGTPASGTAEQTTLTLTITAAATPSFSLSATNASDTASSTTTTTATSTVTETITNGFNSPVTLTASGMPSGVTAAFSPTSITGAGTSTLTFTVPVNQAASTSTITVTGTPASGTAKTTTLTLTITAASSTTYTLIAEPTAGLTPIYNLISSAKNTIDMTMYELTDTTVTSLLATAASKGVTVRVILDQNSEKSSNTTAYNYLSENNVSVHWANPVYTVTHQKTITVDQTTSAIMTLNLTPNYYSTSRDYAVITNDPADVSAIETTFAADFINGTITPPDGDNLVWSPTNSRTALTALINGATTSLQIEQEEMADTGIESALEAALARGVAITLVQENESGAYDTILTTLKNDGAKIAVYTSSTGYYIHAKVILADYGTANAKLFQGSENFSTNSLNDNRELGLIFTDSASMTAVNADITADYNGGTKY
ncbi:MAG: phospholipase D-like domain-containing protein [Terracidiphilus sp.]